VSGLVRALLRVAKVKEASALYDSINLKIFYPALAGNEVERESSVLPADSAQASFPVVVFLPGVNMGADQYQWLAVDLAQRGLVVVLMAWIAENLPGRVSYSPGINMSMVSPDTYGNGPSSTSLESIFTVLNDLQAQSVLAGLLDLNRIVLGGHSAGGTMALMNANPKFFPQVVGAFAYGSNVLATTVLGKFPGGVIPPLPCQCPVLLIGATEDGIGDHHNQHFGRPDQRAADTIVETFDSALTGGRGDSYVAILAGANHHTIAYPLDETIGRTYFDLPERESNQALRELLAELVGDFLEAHVCLRAEAKKRLDDRLQDNLRLLKVFRRK